MALVETAQALEMFNLDYGRYPLTLEDLSSTVVPGYLDTERWRPMLTRPPCDGWRRPLVYRVPGPAGRPFDLLSLGEDGLPGGNGDSADMSYFEEFIQPTRASEGR
jgi:general secretion pathway protein G